MSRGFLMFAHDSGPFSYGSMALANCSLIRKNCPGSAVALVTDDRTIADLRDIHGKLVHMFDHVIIDDVDKQLPLRRFSDTRYRSEEVPYVNTNRSSALDLTPFDETILLDVDYLMLDGTMDMAWGSKEDLMCNHRLLNLHHQSSIERFHDMGIITYWATAMYFRRTDRVRTLFDHMRFVKENYDFYMDVYGFNHGSYFRNDFALSISLHEMNGFVEEDTVASLPIDYILVGDQYDDIHHYDDGSLLITSEGQQDELIPHKVSRNLHVMNKKALLRHCDRIIRYA